MIFTDKVNVSDVISNQEEYSFLNSRYKLDRNLLLFDLSIGGHHPGYIQHLLRHWCEQELSGSINIVVSPKFMQQHSAVVDTALNCTQKNINFVSITPEEEINLKSRNSGINRAIRAFQEWHLLGRYAALLKATHCLVMYFDTCELPLAFGSRLLCPFSGIYFRPTFHYCDFANYVPSRKARLQQRREKFFMSRILHHPQLRNLFCLDPFVIKHIDEFHSQVKAVHLPDPVQMCSDSESQSGKLREDLKIHPDRKIFLLFGSLTDERKGIRQLLEAVAILPPALCQKLCLVFVGGAEPMDRIPLEAQIAAVCQSRPVQVVTRYEFVPDQDVHTYFQLADVVLAPYQQHVGMSGILLLAAAAQKPVLSSNYGLMGEIVQQYSLGLTVDSAVPDEIAKGLSRLLLESPTELGDRANMKSFAEQNSAEEFAHVIFQHL